MYDISEQTKEAVKLINEHYRRKGFHVGMEKTVQLFHKGNNNFRGKIKWLRQFIDILIAKNILNRYKAGYGFVIGVQRNLILSKVLPLEVRMEENDCNLASKSETKLNHATFIRNSLARKHNLIPSMYMNDRVLMNVQDKSPTSLQELWAVDGISNEFVIKYGSEFLEQLTKQKRKQIAELRGRSKMIYGLSKILINQWIQSQNTLIETKAPLNQD